MPALATINSRATLAAASEGSVQRFGNVNSDVLSPLIISYPVYMYELSRTKAEISNTRWVTARNNYVILQNYASTKAYHFLPFRPYTSQLFILTRYSCLQKNRIYSTRIPLRVYNWLSGISLRSYVSVSLILWKVNLSSNKQGRRRYLHLIIDPSRIFIYTRPCVFAVCVFEDIINTWTLWFTYRRWVSLSLSYVNHFI